MNITLMNKLLISFSGGLLCLVGWGAIVVATSQDFAHEGPNSFWFLPVDFWSSAVVKTGLPNLVSSYSPAMGMLLGFVMLLGPFLLIFSVAVHLALKLLHKMIQMRNLR